MLRVYRYKIIIVIFFCLVVDSLSAQSQQKNYNFFTFKKKSHYFGLTLGYISSGFKIEHSNRLISNGVFRLNEAKSNPGLTLSMITNFKIGNHFDFRVLPTVSITNRSLEYTPTNSNFVQTEKIESVFGEIPLLLRFTSAPYKDRRVFIISGVKYVYDFSSNSRTDKNKFDLLRISPHDFQFEIGAGLQFFLPYFIFSPEIKFSHGLNNLLIYDSHFIESTIIEKLFSKSFTISFHFEG